MVQIRLVVRISTICLSEKIEGNLLKTSSCGQKDGCRRKGNFKIKATKFYRGKYY
jgi:hypothetical protein